MNTSNSPLGKAQIANQTADPTVELAIAQLTPISPSSLSPSSLSQTNNCQTLSITLTKPQALIQPAALASTALPAELNPAQPLILFGQAPIWLYSYLISQCLTRHPDLPWLGTYDARGQRVVVIASQTPGIAAGDEFSVALNRHPCPAILVGGPPDSGKSVFSNALRVALKQRYPHKRIYLHRASWDGEGNWAYEANSNKADSSANWIKQLVTLNEFRMHEDPETAQLIPGYFRYHAGAVANLRQLTDCLIVDVGGLPQAEKQPLVEQCSHYIVISRLPEAVSAWHQLCGKALTPLAVIHSVLENRQEIVKTKPLEAIAGPWVNPESAAISEVLLAKFEEVFS